MTNRSLGPAWRAVAGLKSLLERERTKYMRQSGLPTLAFVLVLAGCGVNQTGLSRHVGELLDRCNVTPRTIDATMGMRTRTGIAEFPATAADVAAIVAGLGLQELDPTEDKNFNAWLAEGTSQYDHPMLRSQAGVSVHRSTRRPETLRLRDGSAFEYLLLLWDKSRGLALVQVCYASG